MFLVAAYIWATLCAISYAQQPLTGLPNDRPAVKINTTTTRPGFPPPVQNCAAGENWTSCWSSTCWERQCGVVPSKICSKDCKVGCRCADGFARLGRRCVVETACPQTDPAAAAAAPPAATAPPAAAVFPSMSISSIISSVFPSSRFNQTARECGKGEVWTQCSSSSCFEHRCGVTPSLLCTRDCRMGCKCADGFARTSDNTCVNETQCVTWRSGIAGKGKDKLRQANKTTVAPTAAPEALFVGPFQQRCQGEAEDSKCLVTKSLQATEFVANLESIEGFDFEPGFDYKLLVHPQRVKAGKIKYVLVSITSKIAVKQTKAPTSAPEVFTRSSPSPVCAEVLCMVFCDNGYKKDTNGCEICSCRPAPVKKCPDVTCDNLCPSGYQRNAAGCATCNCAPLTTSLIPPPAFSCNSAADWTLAKVAACCVPLPPAGSAASTLCQTGFQNGFVSLGN